MNERQLSVSRSKCDLGDAESRLREAKFNLKHGFQKSLAALEQAKATHEQEYARLKEDVIKAEINLERERAYLSKAEADLEQPFESN